VDENKLLKYAIDYLSKYDSSKENLHNVLKRKIFKSVSTNKEKGNLINSLNKIILKLEDNKLIDDKRYTESKIYTFSKLAKSKNYIYKYLLQKGINKSEILNAFKSFEKENFDWELKSAESFVRKKRLLESSDSYEKKIGKMARAGFSYEICKKLLN